MTQRRSGLTLGEILILIVVLVAAVSLVLPWLLSQREGSRRALCQQRQKDLAEALLAYELQQGSFPGYANRIAKRPDGGTLAGSWVVPLLLSLGRDDLAVAWRKGEPTAPLLPLLVCPDSLPRPADSDGPPLSYVVNCGLPGDQDTPATGIFMNHNVEKPVYVTLSDIRKGKNETKYTLLLSENLQAGYWTDTAEADVGMVWLREPGPSSGINQCRDVGPRPQDIEYARPSSYHPGVAIAAYCDGHVAALSEKIDYGVYQQLMAVDSKAAGLRGEFDAAAIKK